MPSDNIKIYRNYYKLIKNMNKAMKKFKKKNNDIGLNFSITLNTKPYYFVFTVSVDGGKMIMVWNNERENFTEKYCYDILKKSQKAVKNNEIPKAQKDEKKERGKLSKRIYKS